MPNSRRSRKAVSCGDEVSAKQARYEDPPQEDTTCKAGKVKKVLVRNFMCHDALEVELNPNVNFIVGQNGSGKSAILTALTVGLGAKAHVTSRGNSLKGFIKTGKQSAVLEITLHNKGFMAYKPEVFGDIIVVNRTISASSAYKIKNWRGDVVSRKKRDLELILQAFNIQIDNPISILNQDVSRTFLVASKPEEKYNLFMKATLMDVIGNNYKDAEGICSCEYAKLKQYNEILSDTRKEVQKLKQNIKRVEEIDKSREEVKHLGNERHWATAIVEEGKLERSRENFEKCENNYKEIKNSECSSETKCKEINEKIMELEDKIKAKEQEMADSDKPYKEAKQNYTTSSEHYSMKTRECQTIQRRVKRLEEDRNTLTKQIHDIENGDSTEQNERNELKQQLTSFEQKLDDVEALLRRTQHDVMQFQADKMRVVKDIQSARLDLDSWNNRIEKLKRELHALKSRSNALNVFGTNIPRLLRRIKEEYNNKKFHKMPRGPIGAHIKVKDSNWAAVVENYLGAGLLTGFCVDNSHDSSQLSVLIKEVYGNERGPQILCSKFYERVHDVSRHCTKSPQFSNMLDAMEISDPVIANCLIDQSEVETILLIPTSKEASEIMSDGRKVPRNCKRAFTYQADLFFPDPRYRTYGGPRGLRSKFLQVSTRDTIQRIEEELRTAESSRATALQSYSSLCEREKRDSSELEIVNAQATKLRAAEKQYKASITEIRDKLDANERLDVQVFKNELEDVETKIEKEKKEETRLSQLVVEYRQKVSAAEAEVKRCRELRLSLDEKVNPLKEKVKQLRDAKDAIRMRSQDANRRLISARQALQNATAEYETQQRVTEKALADATNVCERISTNRSPREIEAALRLLKSKIAEIERQFGSLDQLRKELKKKEAKYGKNLELASRIEKNYEAQLKRLKERKDSFSKMKCSFAKNIQNSFSSILALRKKKGNVHIDHTHKTLELEVSDMNDKKRQANDARSLSGGERSYSTVAFILALWDCTGLPFYFLDEFDVFMDKVNRRVIMDILLDHTKSHPQSQFTFLTPLDTSHILAEDYITIHRLAPPERRNGATQAENA